VAITSNTEIENLDNMTNSHPDNQLVGLLQEAYRTALPSFPQIIAFFTGSTLPVDCIRMPRDPRPPIGFTLDSSFHQHLTDSLALNPSIHDGAIVFGRPNNERPYVLQAWSTRIVSNHIIADAEANRGSAYNSAISLSACPSIDMVCLFSVASLEVFLKGRTAKAYSL
jgi:hypothetical protein